MKLLLAVPSPSPTSTPMGDMIADTGNYWIGLAVLIAFGVIVHLVSRNRRGNDGAW